MQQDMTPQRRPKRNGSLSRGLYKRVLSLKKDETEADPEVPGLRYVARQTAAGSLTFYGQLRYRHPVTGEWASKGLGRVLTPFEVEAMQEHDREQMPPEAIGPAPAEHYAFASIRTKARRVLALALSGVDPSTAAGPHGVTVKQAIEQHLREPRDKPLAASTVAYYGKLERLYLGPWLKVPLRRLDQTAIVKLREKLHNEHGRTTAVMALRLLKAAWNTARYHDSKLPPFPLLPKGAMTGRRAKKAAIKPSQLKQWFEEVVAVKSEQRRALWLLGVMTGLRRRDLVTIRREHVDLTAGTLHIPTPKGGEDKAFDLPLSDAAWGLVKRVLRSHNSEWLWPSAKSKSGHIEDPDPQTEDGFSLPWTMHDLRRIYESAAATVVTNGYHLKALVNHALPANDVTAGYISFEADDLRPSQQAVTDQLRKRGLPL